MTFLEEVMGLTPEAAQEVYDDMNCEDTVIIANTAQDFEYAHSASLGSDDYDRIYAVYLLMCYNIRRDCAERGETFDSERFYNSFAGYLDLLKEETL
jgi:hypothetical protein